MAVSTTFNIGDLSPYVEDYFEDPSNLRANSLGDLSPYVENYFEDPSNLRANSLEEGEVDVDHGATDQRKKGE